MRILIIGDSQAGNPGIAAKAALEARGHTVVRVNHDGKGPRAYVATPALWSEYTALGRNADAVVLLFGHNDRASPRLQTALETLRDGVHGPVWMSGPPQYADPVDAAEGAALKEINRRVFGARYIDAGPSTPTSLPRDRLGWHLLRASAVPWGRAIAEAVDNRPGSSGGSPVVGILMAFGLAWTLWKAIGR